MKRESFLDKKIVVPGKDFPVELKPKVRKAIKVFIGIPYGKPIEPVCFQCYVNLIAYLAAQPKYTIATKFTSSAYLDCNRNELAKQAVKGGSDYLLMIDSDMTYPHTILDTLIARDKDVIGVVYYSPRWNKEKVAIGRVGPILYDYDPKKKLWGEWPDCDKKEPFQICAIGTGIMLIKTSVFEKVEEPWFSFFTVGYRKNVEIMGEDIAFCIRCMAAGVDVWADPTMDIGHCKNYIYTKKDCGEVDG